jgi:hypothetical protein
MFLSQENERLNNQIKQLKGELSGLNE